MERSRDTSVVPPRAARPERPGWGDSGRDDPAVAGWEWECSDVIS